MKVLDAETRTRFEQAGATVDDEMVRFDPAMVEELITTAPGDFTLHARNPAHDLVIGGDHLAFGRSRSAPNVTDLDGGRRTGNRHDFRNLLRLVQSLNSIHLTDGYPVEPVDIHGSVRHLETTLDLLTLTDKAIHVYSLGRQRNIDAIEMVRIARGATDEQIEAEPSIFTIINTNSPLTLDVPMSHGIIEMSHRNQIVCVTPFTLAGAMAPITLAGALSQQNAEALVGLMLTQIVRPGSPFIYGGFTIERRHAVGLAGVRHTRVLEDRDRRRPARPPVRRAVPELERVRRQRRRRPGRLRIDVRDLRGDRRPLQSDDARRRLDGGWPPRQLREDGHRRRPAAHGLGHARPARGRRRDTRLRGDRRRRVPAVTSSAPITRRPASAPSSTDR